MTHGKASPKTAMGERTMEGARAVAADAFSPGHWDQSLGPVLSSKPLDLAA